jgi:2-haloacid dehalogenase
MTDFELRSVKALTFDVFGTVVDWRSSIIREGELLSKAKGLEVDWPAFADAWRAGYRPAMDRVSRGEIPWMNIDGLHRLILDGLLGRFGLTGLSADEVAHLNQVWHRLLPWPDAVSGLNRLRAGYVLSTLSNGNVALLVNMAKNAGLPWDCILCAEIIGKYKPDLEVYKAAARLLGYAAAEVMMVAAHPSDLRAAQQAGLRTAYVPRPLEHGPHGTGEPAGDQAFDIVAADFLDLAARLA